MFMIWIERLRRDALIRVHRVHPSAVLRTVSAVEQQFPGDSSQFSVQIAASLRSSQ
jgi:hypothetical protein